MSRIIWVGPMSKYCVLTVSLPSPFLLELCPQHSPTLLSPPWRHPYFLLFLWRHPYFHLRLWRHRHHIVHWECLTTDVRICDKVRRFWIVWMEWEERELDKQWKVSWLETLIFALPWLAEKIRSSKKKSKLIFGNIRASISGWIFLFE